jgi:hypothetical protein
LALGYGFGLVRIHQAVRAPFLGQRGGWPGTKLISERNRRRAERDD